MSEKDAKPIVNQVSEQLHGSKPTVTEASAKKPFVEPTISVATDVLEATTYFQGPTIEAAST